MLREYIRSTIPVVDTRDTNGTIRSALNSKIATSIVNWQSTSTLMPNGTVKGLIDFEVNAYMSSLSEKERIARKKVILKDGKDPVYIGIKTKLPTKTDKEKKVSGTITVTQVKPPEGQIEDGTIVGFSTNLPIVKGERYTYHYSAVSGIYTVHVIAKGSLKPCHGRHGGDPQLGEQAGSLFYDQNPAIVTSTSVKTLETDYSFFADDYLTALCYRLSNTAACYIKNKKYIEFINVPPVKDGDVDKTSTIKTIDLSTYLPTASDEIITIGKYLQIDSTLCVLFFTEKITPRNVDYPNNNESRGYGQRFGQGYIKGQLLLIDRTNWKVKKVEYTDTSTALNQIRYTGVIDMIIDKVSNQLILAIMKSDSVTSSLTYDTAKIVVKKKIPTGGEEDLDIFTVKAFYDFCAPFGFRDITYHVKKTSTKTWSLLFPKMAIEQHSITPGTEDKDPKLELVKTLYTCDDPTFSKKHEYDCYGGYINCMLYQDIFDDKYPLYIGRSYDAWLQLPYLSDDDTYVRTPSPYQNMFRVDKTTYRNACLPGEIIGFFGTAFHKIKSDTELTLVNDIPGDHGWVRTFLRDEPAGTPSKISSASYSTHNSLLTLKKFKTTDYIDRIARNSVFNVFLGGNSASLYSYSVLLDPKKPEKGNKSAVHTLYGTGINVYLTRFIIIHDKTDIDDIKAGKAEDPLKPRKVQVVFTGSYEPQVKEYVLPFYGIEKFRCHLPLNILPEGRVGLFSTMVPIVKDPKTDTGDFVTAAAVNSIIKYDTTSPLSTGYQTWYDGKYKNHLKDISRRYTINGVKTAINQTDASTYYLIMSLDMVQYDIFLWGGQTYTPDIHFYIKSRQMWQLKDKKFSGWMGEDSWLQDIRWKADPANKDKILYLSEETVEYGAEVVCLQYY